MAVPDDEVDGFLSPGEEKEQEEAEKGKACCNSCTVSLVAP